MGSFWFFVIMIVISLVINSKKKKQKEEAARRNARRAFTDAKDGAETATPEAQYAPAARPAYAGTQGSARTIPTERPDARAARPANAGAQSGAKTISTEGPNARVKQEVREMHTTLREEPVQHRLEASQFTGHAHEETSMTGVQEDCPPKAMPKPGAEPVRTAPAAAGEGSFDWDADGVRSGLIMAEILGKPRCMRQGACRR